MALHFGLLEHIQQQRQPVGLRGLQGDDGVAVQVLGHVAGNVELHIVVHDVADGGAALFRAGLQKLGDGLRVDQRAGGLLDDDGVLRGVAPFDAVHAVFQGRNAAHAPGDQPAQLGDAVLAGVGLDDVLPALEADDVDIVDGWVLLVGLQAVDDHGLVVDVDELIGDVLLVAPGLAARQDDDGAAVAAVLHLGEGDVLLHGGGAGHQRLHGGVKDGGEALELLLRHVVFAGFDLRDG